MWQFPVRHPTKRISTAPSVPAKRPKESAPHVTLDAQATDGPPTNECTASLIRTPHFENILKNAPAAVCERTLLFLTPKEIRENALVLSKSWYTFLKHQSKSLWQHLAIVHGLSSILVLQSATISARRSKGHVVVGYRIDTGEAVAIRVVNLEVANAGKDDGVPTSLLREAATLQLLSHPNIVRYFGTEIIKDKRTGQSRTIKMITEYLPKNLRMWIPSLHSDNRFKDAKALKKAVKDVLRQLLCGLQYLHEKGVSHRNLKAENIFVVNLMKSDKPLLDQLTNSVIKIGDFGANRIMDSSIGQYTPEDPKNRERSWREARRLFYRAPELLMRSPTYGLEVDMWSIGVIFLELVLGAPPFSGDNEVSYLYSVFRLVGTPSAENWPQISDLPSVYFMKLPKWKPLPLGVIYYLTLLDEDNKTTYCEVMQPFRAAGRVEAVEALVQFTKCVGWDGLHLLMRMLEMPGCKRISSSEALQHRFLREQREQMEEKCASPHPNTQWKALLHQVEFMQSLCSKHSFKWQPNAMVRMANGELAAFSMFRREIVNWLFAIQRDFQLASQTVHLAVEYMTRVAALLYQSGILPTLYSFISISLASLKIADVFNERSQEFYKSNNISEYSNVTVPFCDDFEAIDKQQRAEDILQNEKSVLIALNFNLAVPTSRWFLDAYMLLIDLQKDSTCTNFAYFVADLSLYCDELLIYSPMLKAQVTLLMAVCTYIKQVVVAPPSTASKLEQKNKAACSFDLLHSSNFGNEETSEAGKSAFPTFIDVNDYEFYASSPKASNGCVGDTMEYYRILSSSSVCGNSSTVCSNRCGNRDTHPPPQSGEETSAMHSTPHLRSAPANLKRFVHYRKTEHTDISADNCIGLHSQIPNDAFALRWRFYLNSLLGSEARRHKSGEYHSVSRIFANFVRLKEKLCKTNEAKTVLGCMCHMEYLLSTERHRMHSVTPANSVHGNYNAEAAFTKPIDKLFVLCMEFLLPECECKDHWR